MVRGEEPVEEIERVRHGVVPLAEAADAGNAAGLRRHAGLERSSPRDYVDVQAE